MMTCPGALPRDSHMPPLLAGPRHAFSRLIERLARKAVAATPSPPPLDPHEWNRIDHERTLAQQRKYRAQDIERASHRAAAEVRARLQAETGNYLEGVVFGPYRDRHSDRHSVRREHRS